MRSTFLIIAGAFILSSCTLPGSAPEKQKPIEYPSTQSGSPAAQYCTTHGGQVTYEKNPSIPTMDLIYCTVPGSEKVDAWKYMDQGTTQSGKTKE
ncbi:DUF333 domain-containing protein [Candidatus Gracilibacteria bacterium]|nr:DUF333 domain-containing protein [Candidatus Gracilibacteria bacterium]